MFTESAALLSIQFSPPAIQLINQFQINRCRVVIMTRSFESQLWPNPFIHCWLTTRAINTYHNQSNDQSTYQVKLYNSLLCIWVNFFHIDVISATHHSARSREIECLIIRIIESDMQRCNRCAIMCHIR